MVNTPANTTFIDDTFNHEKQIDDLEFLWQLSDQDEKMINEIKKKYERIWVKQAKDWSHTSKNPLLTKPVSELSSSEVNQLWSNQKLLDQRQEVDELIKQERKIISDRSSYLDLYNKAISKLESASDSLSAASKNRVRALQAKFWWFANAAKANTVKNTGSIAAWLRSAAEIEGQKQEPINQELANRNDALSANAGQQAATLQTAAEAKRNQDQFNDDLAFKKQQLWETSRQFDIQNSWTESSSWSSWSSWSSFKPGWSFSGNRWWSSGKYSDSNGDGVIDKFQPDGDKPPIVIDPDEWKKLADLTQDLPSWKDIDKIVKEWELWDVWTKWETAARWLTWAAIWATIWGLFKTWIKRAWVAWAIAWVWLDLATDPRTISALESAQEKINDTKLAQFWVWLREKINNKIKSLFK